MLRTLFAMIVGLSLLAGTSVAAPPGGNSEEIQVRVNLNGFSTFDAQPGGFQRGGPFYVSGDICEDLAIFGDCDIPIGEFQCWGWIIGNVLDPLSPAVVSQEFNFFGRGKIQVQGMEDKDPRAVVGGTGDFRNVKGELTDIDLDFFVEFGEFTGTFELQGVVAP